MANQEHLAILMQGVDAWNQWRKQHPEVRPDLSGAVLSKANLCSVNFRGANLSFANFSEANLNEAQLSEARFGDMSDSMNRWPSGLLEYPSELGTSVNLMAANLRGTSLVKTNLSGARLYFADLSKANLTSANLSRAHLSGVDFREADLSGANLSEANLSGAYFNKARLYFADLSGADLSEADLNEVDLREVNFSKVNLSRARLYKAILREANLKGVNLSRADLALADLSKANLSEANLTTTRLLETNLNGATLRMANLCFANLSKADLSGVDLIRADLSGADLSSADLNGADLRRATFVETDFREANLTGCSVYGISAWDVQLAGTKQDGLIVTPKEEPIITVDDLEVAQFIYLLLNHKKLRNVFNAVTERGVLLLGRFGGGGLEILQAVAAKLREEKYLPIIFDFERPYDRDYTETVMTLAGLARFIIVDLSGPSVPQELSHTVPHFDIPFVPILEKGRKDYAMFVDLLKYPWVLRPLVEFVDVADLLARIPSKVIAPAEERHRARQQLLDELFHRK